jgi:fructokinase
MKSFNIIGIGEVLWDFLPTGKQLGGAPANFAYTSKQLGNDGIILSRIGKDNFGKEILQQLKNKNLSTDLIQLDKEKQTGVVNVTLENGQPNYEIVENAAWNFLQLSEDWREIARNADAVCFGSLAQRNEISRKTILGFVELVKGLRIFDVNIRQKYFSREILQESIQLANVVKLNHEELPIITEILKIRAATVQKCLEKIIKEFDLKLICLTRGSNGSLLVTKDAISEHKGFKIEVADAIGAGDAFTAAMTHGILRNWELDKISGFANRVGAVVASRMGAMPDFSEFEL